MTGGRLGECPKGGWAVNTSQVEGRRFVVVDKLDAKLAKMLGSEWRMVDELTRLRNEATEEAMKATRAAQVVPDPLARLDGGLQQMIAKRPRKEMFDDINNKVLVVKVRTEEGPENHEVRILASWNHRCKLQVEMTDDNLNLLLLTPMSQDDVNEVSGTTGSGCDGDWGEQGSARMLANLQVICRWCIRPPVVCSPVYRSLRGSVHRACSRSPNRCCTQGTQGVPEQVAPVISEPNVRWLASRHGVTCRYFDGSSWRVKSWAVAAGDGLQARADSMAAVMQVFYNEHHRN